LEGIELITGILIFLIGVLVGLYTAWFIEEKY